MVAPSQLCSVPGSSGDNRLQISSRSVEIYGGCLADCARYPKGKGLVPEHSTGFTQQPLSQRARFREVVELARWAEDYATLDHLSDGCLDRIIGKGGGAVAPSVLVMSPNFSDGGIGEVPFDPYARVSRPHTAPVLTLAETAEMTESRCCSVRSSSMMLWRK